MALSSRRLYEANSGFEKLTATSNPIEDVDEGNARRVRLSDLNKKRDGAFLGEDEAEERMLFKKKKGKKPESWRMPMKCARRISRTTAIKQV